MRRVCLCKGRQEGIILGWKINIGMIYSRPKSQEVSMYIMFFDQKVRFLWHV